MARALNRFVIALLKVKKNVTSSPFSCLDILLLTISTLSFIADIGTDIVVIFQYYLRDHYMWMILTLSLVCVPSVIVQIFSIRWYIIDESITNHLWMMHIFQLGIFNRYLELFRVGLKVRQSKSAAEIRKFNQQHSDICMLRLFESFMESAPQLVLQLYIMASTGDWNMWTGISAVASMFSLSWGIAAYSKAMRNIRPEKKHLSWWGLIFQSLWRIGTVSARIIAMVLFAVAYGPWLILVIFFHWFFMTLWVFSQKTDFCSTWWEERLYNCVVGSIYCFCFFNLKEGRARWRMALFYLVTSFQNIAFIFCYHFSLKSDPYKGTAVGLVLIGMAVGLMSMLFYYRFFHPSGPILLCSSKNFPQVRVVTGKEDNLVDTYTLKTSRKPVVQDVKEPNENMLNDSTNHLKDMNDSVMSIQSNPGCQSDLHRSHSLNCSFSDSFENRLFTASDLDMSIAKRKVVLSKSLATHHRNVNYNFQTSARFCKQYPKFHCSCLVLATCSDELSNQTKLKAVFPSVSLPNLRVLEPSMTTKQNSGSNLVRPPNGYPDISSLSSTCVSDRDLIHASKDTSQSLLSLEDSPEQVLHQSISSLKFIDDDRYDCSTWHNKIRLARFEENGDIANESVFVVSDLSTCSHLMSQPSISQEHVVTLNISY